jgi:N-acetylmuramoyl-L-alanine amidase
MTIPTSDRPRRRIQRDGVRQWLDTLSLGVVVAAVVLILVTAIRGINDGTPPVAAESLAVAASPSSAPLSIPPATVTAAGVAGVSVTEPAVTIPTATATLIPTTPTSVPPTSTAIPTETPAPPTVTPTPTAPIVAIIVGHRNNDSGAICEGGPYDGTQEVQITTKVTEELVPRLEDNGYTVITLDEFDQRQYGLQASALVSIHVDSCVQYEGTTGYKVARSLNSAIPDIEDRFVQCMEQEYSRVTGLTIHAGSITHNMTNYHAFNKVDLNTPAVIIEVGFLYYDHDLLVNEPDRIAVALESGISCFLDS